jgi:hypothetical protein
LAQVGAAPSLALATLRVWQRCVAGSGDEADNPKVRALEMGERKPSAHISETGAQRVTFLFSAGIQDTQKRPSALPEGLQETRSPEGSPIGFSGIAAIGRSEGSFRLGLAAVELAYGISANRPRRNLRGCGLLAFAIGALVRRTYETAFDEDVRAFLDRRENILGEPRTEDRDAAPLGLRGPFVIGVLPGALRSDGENGELRTVALRLTLLRIGSNEAHDRY